MTEYKHDLGYFEQSTLDSIEKAITEPVIEDALNKAREVNLDLCINSVTEEEVVDIVRGLDKLWDEFIDKQMLVTGDVVVYQGSGIRHNWRVIDRTDAKEDSYGRKEYEEQMKSKGFTAEMTAPGKYQIKLLAQCERPVVVEDGPVLAQQSIGVDIDTARVDFIDILSYERAQHWLEVYAPEAIEEVDNKLLDAAADSASAAIVALKGINMNFMANYTGSEKLEVQKCLKAYIEGLILLDTKFPYVVNLNGQAIVDPGTKDAKILNLALPKAAFTIKGISAEFVTDTDGKEQWHLFLDTTMHEPGSGERPYLMYSEAFLACGSIRDSIYPNVD